MRMVYPVAVCVLLVACAAPNKPVAGTTEAAATPLSGSALDSVKAVDAAFVAGMKAKDTTAVFAVYASDAKVMPPDSPVLDGAAGHPVIAGLIAGGASDFVLNSTTAYGVGDLAYMVGTAHFTMSGVSDSLKYVEVLRRGADGKWRYVVDMFSPIAPSSAAAPVKKD